MLNSLFYLYLSFCDFAIQLYWLLKKNLDPSRISIHNWFFDDAVWQKKNSDIIISAEDTIVQLPSHQIPTFYLFLSFIGKYKLYLLKRDTSFTSIQDRGISQIARVIFIYVTLLLLIMTATIDLYKTVLLRATPLKFNAVYKY